MFVNPKLFFFYNSRNPFVNGDRKCLFILEDNPKQEKYQITTNIPEGYYRICSVLTLKLQR
jgi:hypothetical protein